MVKPILPAPILPGATIGILGGGQLARMLALAAKPMGYRVVVLENDANCPASSVVDEVIVAKFDDTVGLERLASLCDVITLEFENVPAAGLTQLEARVPLRPSSRVLKVSRDRIAEKTFINAAGVKTAPWKSIRALEDLSDATFPGILKTATLGYDGKGQARVNTLEQAQVAFQEFGVPCVLEGLVDFALEISVVVARSTNEAKCFPVFENSHKNGVLDVSVIPARISDEAARAAQHAALEIAKALGVHGLLCIELFVTKGGEVLVNEVAPRPHNSGHITIEACRTSQFEQAIRAVCDLPLGHVGLNSSGAMANLLGDVWQSGEPHWEDALEHGVKLHLYEKREARAGRKMGHLTALGDHAETRVLKARAALMK
jgi:5-(carboxyamino)imidazole ribonucleotide synthase